jgi:transposase-like protein
MEHQGKSFMGCDYNLDRVFLSTNGERHDLWRAVDHDCHVLDILVQRWRDKQAAKRFFRELLERHDVPVTGPHRRSAQKR